MSANLVATLVLAMASVTATATDSPLSSFRKVRSNKHDALMSPSHKDTKWLVFPQQQELHSQSAGGSLRASYDKVHPELFFKEHAETLGVDADAEFTKHREYDTNSGSVTHQKYHQSVQGVPVYGGDFHVTVGSHQGVMSAHGFPLKVLNMDHYDVSSAQIQRLIANGVDSSVQRDLLATAKQHIIETSSKSITLENVASSIRNLKTVRPTVVEWIRTGEATPEGTPASLAYHLDIVASDPFVAYDVFIDTFSLEVVFAVDKTKRSSPFSSPIDADIGAYDMYLKDYNDDKEDDDQSPDPDRMTAATKVFDTTSGSYSFPTTDQELNDLVDYTLYAAHLFNSLSNGQMSSWSSSIPFNIEYNLTIANAYFDGEWGIHFGTGFIADDVVVHEWAHAYTGVLAGLIYMGESGAMNEAFSDIFGEGVDLLVQEGSVQESDFRSTWPLQCHEHVGVDGVSPAGNDLGFRWAMGENISADSVDGQLRDMYYPECHKSPGTVNSQYYVCSEYPYDGSGVHSNSGVLNRVFATLTDGGEYENPSGGNNLVVTALGLTKTLNLFYQAEASLTQYSQFYDAAQAFSLTCSNLIGQAIYYPNVMNMTVLKSNEVFTSADCTSVNNALLGSGMSSTVTHCPNLNCAFDTYFCIFDYCESTGEVVNNDGTTVMNYYTEPPCKNGSGAVTYPVSGTAKYARVFDKTDFSSASFELECIEFGYVNDGLLEATLELYIDDDGGDPDLDMTLVETYSTTIYNVGFNQYAVSSVDTNGITISLSGSQTLVVVLSHALSDSPEEFYSAGYSSVVNTGTDRTFVGGSCISGYQDFASYCAANGNTACSANWFVVLSLAASSGSDDDVCFHVDTVIDYKGVEYSYEDLMAGKEPECSVPHSPSSRGVIISTSCGRTARVTDTHLMATTEGFQLAYTLKAGDVLFGDYHQEQCTILSVKKEDTVQQYFGLNCVHSEVLASGLRASTFGDFHALPSWYMTYVGGLVGSKTASALGTYIAEWYFPK